MMTECGAGSVEGNNSSPRTGSSVLCSAVHGSEPVQIASVIPWLRQDRMGSSDIFWGRCFGRSSSHRSFVSF